MTTFLSVRTEFGETIVCSAREFIANNAESLDADQCRAIRNLEIGASVDCGFAKVTRIAFPMVEYADAIQRAADVSDSIIRVESEDGTEETTTIGAWLTDNADCVDVESLDALVCATEPREVGPYIVTIVG